MDKIIFNKCLLIIREAHKDLPQEEVNKFTEELYDRFLQRFLLKVTKLIPSDGLEVLTPLLEGDDSILISKMREYIDVDKYIDETDKEVRGIYIEEK